jgi:hypothetical protein
MLDAFLAGIPSHVERFVAHTDLGFTGASWIPKLAFFLLIASGAPAVGPLTLRPGQPPIAFEVIDVDLPPAAARSWKLHAAVDSTNHTFDGLEPSTVMDVCFSARWDSFGDSLQLSFSITNGASATRVIRLGLSSATSTHGHSVARFTSNDLKGVSIHNSGADTTIFVLSRDFSHIWVGSSAALPNSYWADANSEGDSVALSWQDIKLLPNHTTSRTLHFTRDQSQLEEPPDDESDKPVYVPALLIIGLMIPNIIVAIICLHCRGTSAPMFTMFGSLTLNAGHACAICYLGLGYDNWLTGVWICDGLWLLNLLCGSLCESGACVVCNQLRMEPVKSASVIWSIRNDRQLPPLVTVTGSASHQESREVATEYESYQEPIYRTIVHQRRHPNGNVETTYERVFSHYETRWRAINEYFSDWGRVTQGGGHFTRIPGAPGNRIERETVYRTVELWRHTDEYVYASWEERASPVEFPRAQLLEIKVDWDMRLDGDAEAQVDAMQQRLYAEGQRHDTTVETFVEMSVPGFTESVSGTLRDSEVAQIQEKYGGCCGFTFWTICLLTGYQAVFESFSRFTSAELKVYCVKQVSGRAVLRAGHKQPDGTAAELAIHVDAPAEPRYTPLLTDAPSYVDAPYPDSSLYVAPSYMDGPT